MNIRNIINSITTAQIPTILTTPRCPTPTPTLTTVTTTCLTSINKITKEKKKKKIIAKMSLLSPYSTLTNKITTITPIQGYNILHNKEIIKWEIHKTILIPTINKYLTTMLLLTEWLTLLISIINLARSLKHCKVRTNTRTSIFTNRKCRFLKRREKEMLLRLSMIQTWRMRIKMKTCNCSSVILTKQNSPKQCSHLDSRSVLQIISKMS